jgi:hypothetical protein
MADTLSKLKELIDAVDKLRSKGENWEGALDDGLNKLVRGASAVESGFSGLARTLDSFSRISLSSSNSINGVAETLGGLSKGVKTFADAFKTIPLIGSAFGPLLSSISATTDIFASAVSVAEDMAKSYDGLDKGTRDLIKTQWSYTANLGLTFDQAVKNKDAFIDLIKANSDLADSGTYLDSEEFKKGLTNLQRAGILMEDLAKASGVASGGINNMQAMTMQATAMGMGIETYTSKMANMVRKSGLSIEDSMKLMASAQTIASETGLRVDDVTQSLESAVSGFQKMGATMDFGRPVLKGFADSVKEVGLGIEQAGDLASEFSKSLLGIVNNPALAYITAMKGGFAGGMGGGAGGVLNPSIQMQAMMLDQGPGAQAELARNLSAGMREMLTSQTGGEVITLKEAAAGDAGTQSRFYTQQQMLGSVYGISDTTTQSRVLEYLEKLESATAEGDQEQISKINQQIAEATKGSDKVFDIQQKISASLDKSVLLLQEQLFLAKENFIRTGGEERILDSIESFTNKAEGLVGKTDDKSRAELESAKNDLSKLITEDVKKAAEGPGASVAPQPAQRDSGLGTNQVANQQTIPSNGNITMNLNIAPEMGNAQVSANVVGAAPGSVRFNRPITY